VPDEYELYADERLTSKASGPGKWFWLGGLVCTERGSARLREGLSRVRADHDLIGEMKWKKISRHNLTAYCNWVDVFFNDQFARFSLFRIDKSSREWSTFRPRSDRNPSYDDRLASAYHQFLIVTFGPLRDSRRWHVFHDAGMFSRETVLKRVGFLFSRTYKVAFGPKSSRIIRGTEELDSAHADLIQLAAVLLGALSYTTYSFRPENSAKAQFVEYCEEAIRSRPKTRSNQKRLVVNAWVEPAKFIYAGGAWKS
jgi:hypothetical protein